MSVRGFISDSRTLSPNPSPINGRGGRIFKGKGWKNPLSHLWERGRGEGATAKRERKLLILRLTAFAFIEVQRLRLLPLLPARRSTPGVRAQHEPVARKRWCSHPLRGTLSHKWERGFKKLLLLLLFLPFTATAENSLYSTLSTNLFRLDGTRLVQYQWKQEPDIIALYFGADWCAPCHAFTPTLREVYETLRNTGANTEVVYVSLDTTESDMRRYMRQSAMPWPAIPPRRLRTLPAIGALAGPAPPNLVLINRQGELLASGWDGRRWLGLQQVLHVWTQRFIAPATGSSLEIRNETACWFSTGCSGKTR